MGIIRFGSENDHFLYHRAYEVIASTGARHFCRRYTYFYTNVDALKKNAETSVLTPIFAEVSFLPTFGPPILQRCAGRTIAQKHPI